MKDHAVPFVVALLALGCAQCGGAAESTIPPASPSLAPPADTSSTGVAPPPPAIEGKKEAAPSAPAAPSGPAHWSYAGEEGPAKWGDLSTDFAACKTGKQQTPVDIPKAPPKGKGLAPI